MSAVFGIANADESDGSRRAQRHALLATKVLRGWQRKHSTERLQMTKTGSIIVRIIR